MPSIEASGLVHAVEIGGDDQPAASFEGGLLAVDAQHFRGHFGAAGGIHREHGCLIGPEHPQPPAVPVLAGVSANTRQPVSSART